MLDTRQYVRHGVGSVRPYISGPIGLPEFLKETFKAIEIERHKFSEDQCHVELMINDSVVVIEAGELPDEVKPWISTIYVYVEDVDSVYSRAVENGAESISEPNDKPYQERQAGFKDIHGNTWWIATFHG